MALMIWARASNRFCVFRSIFLFGILAKWPNHVNLWLVLVVLGAGVPRGTGLMIRKHSGTGFPARLGAWYLQGLTLYPTPRFSVLWLEAPW